MPRISKRTREAAIEACLCIADHWIGAVGDVPVPADCYDDRLASAARARLPIVHDDWNTVGLAWLEAAALLRGDDEHKPWEPGDRVYLRSKES